mmetsp:Transcript_56539/g.143004  ORF Transcript_56539/g.143004 Transcript_56539/m.143004 type:complete len:91 (-) Transcript_56539:82-354(-)
MQALSVAMRSWDVMVVAFLIKLVGTSQECSNRHWLSIDTWHGQLDLPNYLPASESGDRSQSHRLTNQPCGRVVLLGKNVSQSRKKRSSRN